MALPIINFAWVQAKRILHNWSVPALGWNATNQKLYPVQVDDSGNLLVAGSFSATVTDGSNLPYGADEQVIAYYGTTNNIQTVTYKKAGATLKTRTFTYAGGGAANNDTLTGFVDA